MSKTSARLALIFSLVGLGASLMAVYVHYHLLFDPSYTSVCDINASVSCTEVYRSRFSVDPFFGVPVSIYATIWFVAAALLSVAAMVGRQEIRESIPGYLFSMSTMALAATLYLLYISVFVLKT